MLSASGGVVFGDLHRTIDFGEITIWHHLWRLVADANLEASRAPIDELDCPLRLERRDSHMDVLRNDIATVEQTSCHVLAIAWVALDHLVVGLKAGHGDLLHRVGFVRGFGGRHDRGVGGKREVDAWVGY